MSKPLFVLVAGVNGSGKSTFTATFKRHYPNILIIDPDAIALEVTGCFATINQAGNLAGRKALEQIKYNIDHKISFIAESTISGRTYLKLVEKAKEAGFRTVLLYIGLETPELSALRVASRVNKGGHDIPLQHIRRRHPKSLSNLLPHIRIFDIAHVYDNSNQRVWVAGYRKGTLVKQARSIPQWLVQLLKL
tara:strand:+ start:473 stop:1048 length:576 start_codon:yes stop_codon:yes gene_type:complete